jgi:nucleotide-binding universal stress UspA family protein
LKILIATDGSEPVVRACRMVADLRIASGAEVRLLTVVSFSLDPFTVWGEPLADAGERTKVLQEAVSRAVQEPQSILVAMAADLQVRYRFGNAADEIVAEIEEWIPDLVVMGRRGLNPLDRWLMGSVSERVLRHAAVSVLLVP